MNYQDKIKQLNKQQIVTIQYVNNSTGEQTNRQIISTTHILENIKAVDVTNLTDQDKQDVLQKYNDYTMYKQHALSKLFNFSEWITHTTGEKVDLKWRTFKINNIENVSD